ncbi:MAG: hypothetical protein SGI73_17465 [Chloroflexota bacterium]|nr:hypothetical protein [Chloroflexota bacterium]
MTSKPKSLAFPFFIALTVALAVVVHQFASMRGGAPSASALPQAAAIAKDVPREPQAGETQVEGWLSVLYGDPAPNAGVSGTRIVALLDDAGNPIIDLSLPEGLITQYYGAYVRAIGTLRGDARAITGTAQSLSTQSDTILDVRALFPSASATRGVELPDERLVSGAQSWINLLCKFQGNSTTPNTPPFYQSLFSTIEPGLDHYWRQISYNNINLDGTATVTEWRTLPNSRSFYVVGNVANLNALLQDCTALFNDVVNYPTYVGINMFFNDVLDCCAWGGGATLALDGVSKFYRTTYLPTWAVNHGVIAHEMGHGYGFDHSTGPANNPPVNLSIYVSEWDVMSDSQGTCAVGSPSFQCLAPGTNSYHLRGAEWIPADRIVTVPTGGDQTFTLERTVLPQSTTNALMAVVPIGGSAAQFYTVEARNIGAGYDQNIPASAVIIHDVNTARSGNGGASYVVDADTNNVNTNDAGARWLPGETYTDVARGISIEVLSQSGSTFTVRVINNSVTPTPPPPPSNDSIDSPRLVSTGGTYTQEWYGATDNFADPTPTCAPFAGTVWFRFTAPTTGSVILDTIGSTTGANQTDTVMAVYTLNGSLTEIVCNDDIVTGQNVNSQLQLDVTAGTQYYLVVGNYGANPVGGPSTLFLSLSGTTTFITSTPTATPSRTPTAIATATRTPTGTPTLAPDGNLIRNGAFNETQGNGFPLHWSIYGLPTDPLWELIGGVLGFYRPSGNMQGVIFQAMNTTMPAGTLIEARLDLGNSSGTRQRTTILLHDGDFSDLFVCTFWLPPNTPLTEYRMTGRPTEGWTDAHLSIYGSTVGDAGYVQVDNVYVAPILNDGSNSVLCYDPFAP